MALHTSEAGCPHQNSSKALFGCSLGSQILLSMVTPQELIFWAIQAALGLLPQKNLCVLYEKKWENEGRNFTVDFYTETAFL